MQEIIFIIHILTVVSLIGLVLMQHGKGADMGAAFGSGSSNTMFGSSGSISFFTKLTALIAAIFFATSIILGVLVSKEASKAKGSSIVSSVPLKKRQVTEPVINQEQKADTAKVEKQDKKAPEPKKK